MKRLIIASTSTIHNTDYLEYILPTLADFFKNINTILFIPYARPSGITYDAYTLKAKEAFAKIGKTVVGIHSYSNPVSAIKDADAIFTGGGNTFELVNQLYKTNIIDALDTSITTGTPYFGTSAGSNICGISMMNTNDMPIVYPPSFKTLGLIPFNINAHYLDPDLNSKHMGETRETRINEFHVFNTTSVLGLREGSWLEVINDTITLKGHLKARWFQQGKSPLELEPNTKLNTIL